MKKRILSVVLALCIAMSAAFAVGVYADDANGVLRFNENGEFTIMHLTDTQDGYPTSEKMLKYIDYMLKTYKPDIVILGGDNCVGKKIEGEENQDPAVNIERSIEQLVSVFVENKTYFTFVFGNHDHQYVDGIDIDPVGQGKVKEHLLGLYQKYGKGYCLAYDADPSLHGVGTHNLPILASDSDKIKFNLWMFDSGSYAADENGKKVGYDCVREDQIAWYQEKSAALDKLAGEQVKSLAFQHIVVGDVYDNLFYESIFDLGELGRNFNGKHYSFLPKTENFTGQLFEYPCPGYYNCGQFDAMVKQGNVLGIFSGHDHVNSYETERDGVWIINTPGATYHSYGNDLVRGSRLITINEKDTSTFSNRIVTVNDAAIADETFAADVGISPTFAKIQMFFGEVAKVLGRAASPLFKVLGYLSKFA